MPWWAKNIGVHHVNKSVVDGPDVAVDNSSAKNRHSSERKDWANDSESSGNKVTTK